MSGRGRPKKVKENDDNSIMERQTNNYDDPNLSSKSLFRIDEVAAYFGVSERTIRLWIEHGHLGSERVVGSIRISRHSILRCRFKGLAGEPML